MYQQTKTHTIRISTTLYWQILIERNNCLIYHFCMKVFTSHFEYFAISFFSSLIAFECKWNADFHWQANQQVFIYCLHTFFVHDNIKVFLFEMQAKYILYRKKMVNKKDWEMMIESIERPLLLNTLFLVSHCVLFVYINMNMHAWNVRRWVSVNVVDTTSDTLYSIL